VGARCGSAYPRSASTFGAKAIHPANAVFEMWPEVIRDCHMRNIRVNFWTVDDPDRQRLLAEAGCDTIITNKPDVCITALKDAELY